MEILLIPDLKSMNRAIENHAAEHVNKGSDRARPVDEKNRIREQLIAKVFETIDTIE